MQYFQLFLIIIFPYTLFAQDDHDAIVLSEIGNTYFYFDDIENRFKIIYDKTTKIQILKAEGVEWANISIPYYVDRDSREEVRSIKAKSINFENDEPIQTTLDQKDIYEDEIDENRRRKKFAIPNAKKGSIIEYSYRISSPFVFELKDWYFQKDIPVKRSEFTFTTIPFYEYVWILKGREDFDEFGKEISRGVPKQIGMTEYRELTTKCVMTDVPAFDDEEFITSREDVIIKMNFQLSKINYIDGGSKDIITDWDKVATTLNQEENFGKYIKKSSKYASKVFDVTKFKTYPQKERFNKIVDLVKSKYRYNNWNTILAHQTLKEFTDKEVGSCANINLLLIGFLKAVEIDARPILISTRAHGQIPYDYPILDFFNYVAVLVDIDGKQIMTDATDPLLPNNKIPIRCMNDKGLVLTEKLESWVDLRSAKPSVMQHQINIRFSEKVDSLICDFKIGATNYDGLKWRKKFTNEVSKLEEQIANSNFEYMESTASIENFEAIKKPYYFKYQLYDKLEGNSDLIYLNPLMNLAIDENPLKKKSRNYPVDMTYPKTKIFKINITIPENYRFDYIPENLSQGNEICNIEYISTKVDEQQVQIKASYAFPKSIYNKDEYLDLQAAYRTIVEQFNEQIVIKKK